MRTLKGLCMAALLVLILPAGCMRPHGHYGGSEGAMERGSHEMDELVDKSVKDPAKAEVVKTLIKEIVQEAKLSNQQKREYHRQLYDLNAKYDAPVEDFTKVLDDAHNASMRSATKILGLRFKIKNELTADDWKELIGGMGEHRSRYWGDKGGS